ncbi:hypothetical protein S58_05530 [Bradyrhizobium oligotrophicum S58]|uniref:Uncharacterized protein n=1 Tax=Bradyrhizobium oligotrophicum S58 TaxID=1245469 RepID=M4Z1I3_9BRAD|nr:hypothetical protein S58_05530 [Bradyrhizobium oligotrophicum S58]
MPPEYTGLHGADRVIADNPARPLQSDSRKLRGGGMQCLHRQVDAWRNHASLEAAITSDHIQGDSSAAVYDNQWAPIQTSGAEGID